MNILDTLFPSPAAMAALAAVGVCFGLVLSVAKIKLQVVKDPRIDLVIDALPGANCGACGFPGCAAYAEKIVAEGLDFSLCPVGGSETVSAIGKILSAGEVKAPEPEIAKVHCRGGLANSFDRFIYSGPLSCTAAHAVSGGYKSCEYACLGFGDCVDSCQFAAIEMNDNRIPEVFPDKCVGCGSCAFACPRGVITMAPARTGVTVMCRNTDRVPVMKKACSVGCTGCRLCEKNCPYDAIHVENFRAVIDYSKCTDCGKCSEVCPFGVITPPLAAVGQS